MANIGFISLGCAKNQVDCERMMFRVQEAGYTVNEGIVGSDVVVINTCGFIDSAKSEAIDYILSTAALKAEGQVGKILVTGCLSQRYQGDILQEMPEVDGILGTGSYTKIVPAIEQLLSGHKVVDFGSIDAPEEEIGRVVTTPEHFSYIKIAEGCNNRCAFCIIPYLRGKYRSRQLDDVLYEARVLAANGTKELIVVAQDTSRYGTDFPEHKRLLPELLRELCKIDGLHWIRVHYVYPDEIDDELIDVIASEPKIVKYLDIPIQHCNDKILSTMHRRGDKKLIEELFAKLRARIPGLVIRTSLIAGLPGEGEEEFQELCQFLGGDLFSLNAHGHDGGTLADIAEDGFALFFQRLFHDGIGGVFLLDLLFRQLNDPEICKGHQPLLILGHTLCKIFRVQLADTNQVDILHDSFLFSG